MSLKDVEDFKLYTVAQVAELLPPADARSQKGHVRAVEELIIAHGCYRKFGEQILLTQGDIRALFRAMAHNSRASDGEPLPTAEGYVVAIGHRTDPEYAVFIDWAPLGGVDQLIRDVQRCGDFKAEYLDHAPCQYGDFKEIAKRLKPHRYYGAWYVRGEMLQAIMNDIFKTEIEDEDEV